MEEFGSIVSFDIGGGLGVSYSDEVSPDLGRFARALVSRVKSTGLTLLMEPVNNVFTA